MRILFLGDIFARPGREKVAECVPILRQRLGLDLVVANGENAAHGFGITPSIAETLLGSGVDVLTNGNHAWDRPEIANFLSREARLLRPLNDSDSAPGNGVIDYTTPSGHRVLVINLLLRLFMQAPHDPWSRLKSFLSGFSPKQAGFDAIILDLHGEATSEKQGFGYLSDGQVTLAVGTHTHVPTADLRILPKGTAFQSDAGMCGVYESIIGMQVESSVGRIRQEHRKSKLEPAEGIPTLSGVVVETDPATGLAKRVQSLVTAASVEQLQDFSTIPTNTGGELKESIPIWN